MWRYIAYTISCSLQKGFKIPSPPRNKNFGTCPVCWARYHWKIFEISYSRATIEDLEAVITSPATMKDGFKTVSSQKESTYHDDTPTSIATANFSDGSYVGEILEKTDYVTYRMSYMSPKFISTADYNEHKRRYWYWSSKEDIFDTNTSCMLNLKPVISIATPRWTKRFYIFACYNAELLEIIANSVFDVMLLFT